MSSSIGLNVFSWTLFAPVYRNPDICWNMDDHESIRQALKKWYELYDVFARLAVNVAYPRWKGDEKVDTVHLQKHVLVLKIKKASNAKTFALM